MALFQRFLKVIGLEGLLRALQREQVEIPVSLNAEMDLLGAQVTERIRSFVPRKTTALASTIAYSHVGTSIEITEGMPYGIWVRLGTRPHPIYPRYKRALWWPGAEHPVPMVNHPGTKAVDYPGMGMEQAEREGLFARAEARIGQKIDVTFVS